LKDTSKHQGLRNQLAKQLEEKGITDKNVLDAIRKIPRLCLSGQSVSYCCQSNYFTTLYSGFPNGIASSEKRR
jgi:protein-L-isoaspartate(D-aspartate) O-methyltransferase